MANDCDAVLIGICCYHRLPYRSNPVVGAVGEMASMKRCKLWQLGEDGLYCCSSVIQTRLGPSPLLEERSEIPTVFVVSFVLSATPPNWGKRPRYIDRIVCVTVVLVCYVKKKWL